MTFRNDRFLLETISGTTFSQGEVRLRIVAGGMDS